MADDNEKPENVEGTEEEQSSGGAGRALIIAFIGVIVLLETAMFFFLVPSAEQLSAIAEEKLVESVQEGAEAAEEQELDENKIKEFKLGMYGETFSPIDTERTFRVEIDLYALIRQKNSDAMKAEFESKEGRLRHAIRMKIRNSALSELQENQLGLLERRILTECNHLLDEDLLLGIGFNSYQLTEE